MDKLLCWWSQVRLNSESQSSILNAVNLSYATQAKSSQYFLEKKKISMQAQHVYEQDCGCPELGSCMPCPTVITCSY